MYTANRTSGSLDHAVPLSRLLTWAATFGLIAGACVVVDSLLADTFGDERTLLNLFGIVAPGAGLLGITGLYVWAMLERSGRALDVAYAVNVVGLAFVLALDFTRTFVLARLDDDVREGLLESGTTLPAVLGAAGVYILGTVLFGVALIRRGREPVAAWIYVLTAVPSGLVLLLPAVVGAIVQALAGASIIWLCLGLRAAARRPLVVATT
jgi:hypothetical protein